MKVMDWIKNHKALIGTVLVAVGGVLTGQAEIGAAIAAILAALSAGAK